MKRNATLLYAIFCMFLLTTVIVGCRKEKTESISETKREEFRKGDEHKFEIPIVDQSINPVSRGGCSKIEVGCIDWYLVTYDGHGNIVGEQFLYTSCSEGGSCGGSSTNNILELRSACPESFNFREIVPLDQDGGGWQEAAVSDIHFNVVSNVGDVKSRSVELPVIYFGLPKRRSDGSFYSPGTAAKYAAECVKKAEREAHFYGRNNPNISDFQVGTYWLERINYWMKFKYAGSARKQPALSNQPSVAPTKAKDGC